ncbi:MAG: AAA family ATPase, partial [Flavobacteriales bacterium]|nr:AAA family ATPase [Flavobacteriales bacterium]
MITRLHIKGFKNFVDAQFHFGPFNCIAGLNGVGKSNLFDAIQFLSSLADRPFVEAAKSIRGGDDVLQLRCGNEPGPIEFDLDMIISQEGTDEFNQPAIAGSTYLNYILKFEVRISNEAGYSRTKLELVREELNGYTLSHATKELRFRPSREWVKSVVKAGTRVRSYIRSKEDRIELQADRMKVANKKWRGGGKPTLFNTSGLPRSVLSSAQNADENRTAVLVRKEMRSWKQLQLEPSSLGQADDFDAPRHVDRTGAHIP